ncbi:hypothetical protein DFA_11615 [Cavenderia fasciculata]|uniref:Uncharacterized protein n=1 Tax=Cavenderia fasciculata TaxID=261658 RepID=F4QDQ7_CACFS|nr:uncharacterized protein DFA_11615 [Cavenderia fasciculata]EGG13854.1 hypothetical protein DFA_11615 [Cavenderia fasciculata]|eukprot:XP_004350562.1 hypothetical protein DFA_11615 [Cavenderia fasciculata]
MSIFQKDNNTLYLVIKSTINNVIIRNIIFRYVRLIHQRLLKSKLLMTDITKDQDDDEIKGVHKWKDIISSPLLSLYFGTLDTFKQSIYSFEKEYSGYKWLPQHVQIGNTTFDTSSSSSDSSSSSSSSSNYPFIPHLEQIIKQSCKYNRLDMIIFVYDRYGHQAKEIAYYIEYHSIKYNRYQIFKHFYDLVFSKITMFRDVSPELEDCSDYDIVSLCRSSDKCNATNIPFYTNYIDEKNFENYKTYYRFVIDDLKKEPRDSKINWNEEFLETCVTLEDVKSIQFLVDNFNRLSLYKKKHRYSRVGSSTEYIDIPLKSITDFIRNNILFRALRLQKFKMLDYLNTFFQNESSRFGTTKIDIFRFLLTKTDSNYESSLCEAMIVEKAIPSGDLEMIKAIFDLKTVNVYLNRFLEIIPPIMSKAHSDMLYYFLERFKIGRPNVGQLRTINNLAIRNGHLDTVKWIDQNIINVLQDYQIVDAFYSPPSNQRLELIKFIYQQQQKQPEPQQQQVALNKCYSRIKKITFEELEYITSQLNPTTEYNEIIQAAVGSGDPNLLDYVLTKYNTQLPIDTKVAIFGLNTDIPLEMVKYMAQKYKEKGGVKITIGMKTPITRTERKYYTDLINSGISDTTTPQYHPHSSSIEHLICVESFGCGYDINFSLPYDRENQIGVMDCYRFLYLHIGTNKWMGDSLSFIESISEGRPLPYLLEFLLDTFNNQQIQSAPILQSLRICLLKINIPPNIQKLLKMYSNNHPIIQEFINQK